MIARPEEQMTLTKEVLDCMDACTGCMQLCLECAAECERQAGADPDVLAIR